MPILHAKIALVTLVAIMAGLLLAPHSLGQHGPQHGASSGSVANVPVPARPTPSPPAQSSLSAPKAAERMREHTRLIDVVGSFQMIGGETITFTPGPANSNKESLRVLENLPLERVGQVLDGNKGARQWTISGTITEYRGANYLLLSKAVQMQESDSAASR